MNDIKFEEALKKLEEIVKKLENSDINLDDAIKYYEEGLKLSKICDDIIKMSEEKLKNN